MFLRSRKEIEEETRQIFDSPNDALIVRQTLRLILEVLLDIRAKEYEEFIANDRIKPNQ